MKTAFSRSHQRELKLQTILSAAARLFNIQGTRATTVSDIADSIGLTKTSLYYYARNKEELIYLCYVGLRNFFARGTEIMLGQRPHAAMLVEIPALGDKHRKEIEDRVDKHFDTVLGFMQRGIEDGSVRACEPVPATQAFLALLRWAYFWFGAIPLDARPAVIEQLLSLVQHGVSTSPYRFQDIVFPVLDDQLPTGFDRDKQNEIKRNAFLQVGSMMFNQKGYAGTSLDDVVKQLDVTKGAFYYHIRNKEDMLYQCFQRTLELENEMMEQACEAGGNGAEKIEKILRFLFNVQNSDDGPLIAYRSLLSLDEQHRQEIYLQTQAISNRLGDLVKEGIEDGSIRNVDPSVVQNAMAGTVDAAPDVVARMQIDDNARVSAEYLELFFNGLAP
jgi:AcrR family transcriptional regulator